MSNSLVLAQSCSLRVEITLRKVALWLETFANSPIWIWHVCCMERSANRGVVVDCSSTGDPTVRRRPEAMPPRFASNAETLSSLRDGDAADIRFARWRESPLPAVTLDAHRTRSGLEFSPGHPSLLAPDRKAFFLNSPTCARVTLGASPVYKGSMSKALSRRLKQSHFTGPTQEAVLSLLLAANALNDLLDDVCEKHRITRPQYNVLRILRGVHPKGHPRCEIARRMIERAPDITRLVDRLQARGLVKRRRGDDDLRQAMTCITAKGLKLLEAMQPEIESASEALLGKLTDADCRKLTRLCALIFDTEGAEGLPSSAAG